MTLAPRLIEGAALIVPLVLAIVCHEMAHGLVARRLGDDTAARLGRLSFNPLRHVDPVGTILLPGALALAHAPVFGWARPVPVDARRLHHPRQDMMLVGAAGPASNLVLAGIGAVALGLMVRAVGAAPGPLGAFVLLNLFNFLGINLFLALFNLLPVPPFDGSHIVEGLLPARLAAAYARSRRFALAIMLGLIVVLPMVAGVSVVARLVEPPAVWLLGQYAALAAWVAGAPVPMLA